MEWTVSETTVAGIFVAVFFVVSEGAQVLFAGVAGSQTLGIIAAGALLFALAPIQKLADRVAEKAVPGGGGTPAADADSREAYKDALRAALGDDELTAEEEHHLERLAMRLGIDAEEAFELREQVEGEGDASE